jgi:hypothetical protein
MWYVSYPCICSVNVSVLCVFALFLMLRFANCAPNDTDCILIVVNHCILIVINH